MIKLEKLRDEELDNQPGIVIHLINLYGNDLSGDFYKYNFNGTERWLYTSEGYCTTMYYEGKYLLYSSFYVNSDYTISYMEFDEFAAGIDPNGELMLWKEGDLICESLSTIDRTNLEGNNGYTGLVVHHQRNTETGEEILITYQNQYRKDGHIFSCNLHNPFVICFINGKKVSKYFNYKADRNNINYDLITINEFGLFDVLAKGSFALQRSFEINRYFKIRHQMDDGHCILLIPFSYGIKEDEMMEMIRSKGFRLEVPSYVLDYYNGEYEETEEYKQLAEALKEYALEHNEEKKLVKDSDSNGNSTL